MKFIINLRSILEISARLWIGLISLTYLCEKLIEPNIVTRMLAVIFIVWSILPIIKEENK